MPPWRCATHFSTLPKWVLGVAKAPGGPGKDSLTLGILCQPSLTGSRSLLLRTPACSAHLPTGTLIAVPAPQPCSGNGNVCSSRKGIMSRRSLGAPFSQTPL